MWGTYIRAAFAIAVGGLLAAVLAFVLGVFIPVLESGAADAPQEAQPDMVVAFFANVEQWFALVVLLSIGVFVLGRAVLENRLGGVR